MEVSIDSNLKDSLSLAVLEIGADYAEIRAEESFSTRIGFRGKDPEVIASPYSLGFFIRVLVNGSWGIATFTDISQLKPKIKQAVENAKLAGKGQVEIAPPPSVHANVSESLKKDFRQIPLQDKVELVKKYNGMILKGAKGIQTTAVSYGDNYLSKFFVNSKGARIFQQRPYVRLSFQGVARDGEVIEMYRGSCGHVGGYEAVEGQESEMLDVAKQAVELSKAPKVKSGNYTVILDPYMAGTFAHEAFGHFSEADHQYENPQILQQMKIGRVLGSEFVTIVDDPGIEEGWGNFVYDDEGVEALRVELLKNGVIAGRLHSLETAAKLSEKPNGRARADGFSSKPIVRMSNTYFERGKSELDDMIKSTKKGILVINWMAGMTALESFTFTAMYGIMIENGKLAHKVRGVKLLGNIFATLKNIKGVSNDYEHDQGTCGKQGQYMPVGSGGAYVLIDNVTVGGE